MCGECKWLLCETQETRSVGQSGASMRSIKRHGLCVQSSEFANICIINLFQINLLGR